MIFQPRLRLAFAVFGSLLVAATMSCGGPGAKPQTMTRLGDDAIVGGGSAYIRDSVLGDLIVASGDVDFVSATGGDYLGAGGKQRIAGQIHGSLRAAGGSIEVRAAVDRNATIAGGTITLDSTAVIAQNAYITGGAVQVDGTVRGGLLVSAGSVTLNGVVGRDVEITGGELRVGPHAQIAGNLRYRVSPEKVHIDSAAHITGTVTALPVGSKWGLRRWLWILGVLLAGAVVVMLFPGFMSDTAGVVPQRPILAACFGVAVAILSPIMAVILAITFIGLPLALLVIAVYCLLLFMGNLPVAVWMGRRLLATRGGSTQYAVVLAYLVGGVILVVVGLIPVIGSIVMIIAAVIGIGAILIRGWSSRNQQAFQVR